MLFDNHFGGQEVEECKGFKLTKKILPKVLIRINFNQAGNSGCKIWVKRREGEKEEISSTDHS